MIVRFTDGMGPLNPAYGMWQDMHSLISVG